MDDYQPLNAWERGVAQMGRRFGASDAIGDFVTEDARADLCRAWTSSQNLTAPSNSRSASGLRALASVSRDDFFEADDEITLAPDDFDPTRIAAAGPSDLDEWFFWSGAVGVVMLVGDDARKRARLKARLDSFESAAGAADSVLWPPEVRRALRDAYVEIDERSGDGRLRQKARHLGMFATGLGLGPRRAPGLAPILWRVMDAHEIKSFRRHIIRGLASRRASASSALRRILAELQHRYEARDE